jgi:hypothetical protein
MLNFITILWKERIFVGQVSVELEHLGLVAVGQPAEFTIRVPEGADAELAVSVQGPVEDIPVKVTGARF